jgi:hypothetical protein
MLRFQSSSYIYTRCAGDRNEGMTEKAAVVHALTDSLIERGLDPNATVFIGIRAKIDTALE